MDIAKKRFLLGSFFVVILTLFFNLGNSTPLALLGYFLLSLMVTSLSAIYLRIASFPKMALLTTLVVLPLVVSQVVEFFMAERIFAYPLYIPFAAILLCLLLGSEIALFSSFFLSLIMAGVLDVEPVRFCMLNFTTSLVAILYAKNMHKQKEIFPIVCKVWLSSLILIISFHFIDNSLWSPQLLDDALYSFLFMLGSALLVIAILPILESVFNVMTDMTLLEFADPGSPLLKRLSLEAPGTYQHSLVVGNLAEAAARAISANGLFCRVSTLYHDIGKLFNPHYFNENQLGGLNIHQLLTPKESAGVIIAHITEGETLARKYRLPKSFVDIIKEHHGTTLVQHFYSKQCELTPEVNLNDFCYRGPKPRSKESAIIMIADKVEAASRSLTEVSEESIAKMVEQLVTEKVRDGQLDECQLTFEELKAVKKEMIKTLIIARHLRVK